MHQNIQGYVRVGRAAAACAVLLSLQGCVVATVAGAAVGIAATVVETGVSVAGTAVRGATAVGDALIDAATSDSKKDGERK